MKQRENARPRARVVSVLLVVFLGWAAAAGAAEPAGGQAEGIKVHGHWTIDVRNPNGTLASHHEVENALAGGGPIVLAGLLANFYSDPLWEVSLSGLPLQPCNSLNPPVVARRCIIVEPRFPPSSAHSTNLTVNLPVSGAVPDGTLEISGSVTVANDTTIGTVESLWHIGSVSGPFTTKTLSTPIPVRQGQIIQVKVVFSFS